MKRINDQITKGTRLKYIGQNHENFRKEQPYMEFLGFDSNGWDDIWVNYNGKYFCIDCHEVERAE